MLYLLALSGIIARPEFPFDPNRFRVGAGQIVAMILLAAVIGARLLRDPGWRVPAGAARTRSPPPRSGLVSAFAVLVAWLANPFLALLLVPVAHVWLLGARRVGPFRSPLTLGAIALSLLPIVAATLVLAGRLDLGPTAPWQLLLMVGDGQIGFVARWRELCRMLPGSCLLARLWPASAAARRSAMPPGPDGQSPGRTIWTHLRSRA